MPESRLFTILKDLTPLLATIVVPVALAVIANTYNASISARDIGTRYIELAVDILKDKPDENNRQIRKWAIDILNQYSAVKIPDDTAKDLLNIRIKVDISSIRPEIEKDLEEIFKNDPELFR